MKWGVIVFVERCCVECWVWRDRSNDTGKEESGGRVLVGRGCNGRGTFYFMDRSTERWIFGVREGAWSTEASHL